MNNPDVECQGCRVKGCGLEYNAAGQGGGG